MTPASRINVLVLTSYWPSAANPVSGIFVQQQVTALDALGLTIRVVAPRPAPRHEWRRPLLQSHAGIPVLSPAYACLPSVEMAAGGVLGFNARACTRAVARAARTLQAEFRPDVLHVHGARYSGMAIPELRRWFDCGVVWTLHGVDPYLQRHCDTLPARRLLQRALAATDCTTIVGRTLAPYAETLGMAAARLRIVPNGTDTPVRSPLSDTIRERHRGKRILLSVSNLHRDKGVHLNLQALAGLDDAGVVYLVVGDGPERASLTRQARELGLQHRVFFAGRLPHAETMAYMDACDVFCLPSRREAFGIVYIEAMIRGKPVIGCEATGAAEIVRPGVDGLLVRADDEPALAAALGSLLGNAALRHRLGAAAAANAARFSWRANAAAYVAIYDELIRGSGAASSGVTDLNHRTANKIDSPAYET